MVGGRRCVLPGVDRRISRRLDAAGFGVRELVFVAAMNVILPKEVQASMGNQVEREVILGLLSLLLRVWAIGGELLLAGAAYLLDYRGAMGRSDAPGRVAGVSSSSTLSD